MKDQLIDRYLKRSSTTTGIYVVGWFSSRKWDSQDKRRAVTRSLELTAVKNRLIAQAESLSTGGYSIKACILDARIL